MIQYIYGFYFYILISKHIALIMNIKNIIQKAPETPGIYQMISSDNSILYIGKAKNIKKRLLNYIGNNLNTRTILMVRQISKIEYVITSNEAEALLLESRLIKKHQPKYNVLLKDDKSFPYIMLRQDHDFSQISKYRGKVSDNKFNKFFGPFANIGAVNNSLKFLQKTFKLRNCTDSYFSNRTRPCLQYQIGRCSAPCVGKISKEEYGESVKHAMAFLSGESQELQNELAYQMTIASNNMEYEKAAEIRNKIQNLSHIQLSNDRVKDGIIDLDAIAIAEKYGIYCVAICFYRGRQFYGNKLYFPIGEKNSLSEVLSYVIGLFYQNTICPKEIIVNIEIEDKEILEEALFQLHNIPTKIHVPMKSTKKSLINSALTAAEEGLKIKLKTQEANLEILNKIAKLFDITDTPQRIEIYDNSHIMGSHAVGAMVVSTPEGFSKKEYRSYNVENKTGDDYAMLREVMNRRMKKIISGEGPIPDLVIIDGGKGQLSTAVEVMKKLGLSLNIIAMSKGVDRNAGREMFHMISGKEFTLDKNDQTMKYLQLLRDEAHNFAISKHRKKRTKAIYFSSLDDIESIGAARKKALLNFFGGIDTIKSASIEDLMKVPGISKSVAEKLFLSLH
jgi:excinuclease ABC subunit C